MPHQATTREVEEKPSSHGSVQKAPYLSIKPLGYPWVNWDHWIPPGEIHWIPIPRCGEEVGGLETGRPRKVQRAP